MKEILIGFAIGGGLLALGLLCAFAVKALYNMARKDFIFTTIEEGQAKVVKCFGKFHKILIAYKEHGLDQYDRVRRLDENGQQGKWLFAKDDGTIEERTGTIIINPQASELWGGLFLIGFPIIYAIHWYRFSWTSREEKEVEGKVSSKIVNNDKIIDYILAKQDTYYTLIEGAENAEGIPINAGLLMVLEVTYPGRALFTVQNWLETIINQIKPAMEQYIKSKKWEDLKKSTEQLGQLGQEIMALLNTRYFEARYGVLLKQVMLVNPEMTGAYATAYEEASTAVYKEEQNSKKRAIAATATKAEKITLAEGTKKEKEILAEGEKTAIETIAKGEKKRVEDLYEAIISKGEEGMAIRQMEAIETTGKGGNTVIIPSNLQSQLLINTGHKQPTPAVASTPTAPATTTPATAPATTPTTPATATTSGNHSGGGKKPYNKGGKKP